MTKLQEILAESFRKNLLMDYTIKMWIAIFVFTYNFFLQNLIAEDQTKIVDNTVSKIVENVKAKVPENQLDIYEKFSRKVVKSLVVSESSKEEINFLIEVLSNTIIDMNNKNPIKNVDISLEIREELDNERQRVSSLSLKNSYQIWIKNNQLQKKNIMLIKSIMLDFFTNYSLVIFDSNFNNFFYKSFKDTEISNQKFNVETDFKKHFLEQIDSTLNNQIKMFNQKYETLFFFGMETPKLEEEKTLSIIGSQLKDIFLIKDNVIYIGDFSEINFAVNLALVGCFDKVPFDKISRNSRSICLQIYLKRLLKDFKDKNDFIPAHYGKNLELQLIKNTIFSKYDLHSEYAKKLSKEEYIAFRADYENARDSWKYLFCPFFDMWNSTLLHNMKYSCPEEALFIVKHFDMWKNEYQPVVTETNRKMSGKEESYQAFSNLVDEMFLFDKDFFLKNIQDETYLANQTGSFQIDFNKKKSKYFTEYLSQKIVNEKYLEFIKNIQQWSKENFLDKLSGQELKDIPIRKQFRLLLSFLTMDENTPDFKYTYNKLKEIENESEIWNIYGDSIQKLYDLDLITGSEISDEKLKEKKLTALEFAIYDYFKKSLKKNPVFNYFDFDNSNKSDIQRKYKIYLDTLIPEDENEARKLIIKMLLNKKSKQ